jgi:hypothetical protein
VHNIPAPVIEIKKELIHQASIILRDALCDLAYMDKFRRFYARNESKKEIREWMADKNRFRLIVIDALYNKRLDWVTDIGRLAYHKNPRIREHVYEAVRQISADFVSPDEAGSEMAGAVFLRFKGKESSRFVFMGLGASTLLCDARYKLADLSTTIRRDIVQLCRFRTSNWITQQIIGELASESSVRQERDCKCLSEVYAVVPVEPILDYYA